MTVVVDASVLVAALEERGDSSADKPTILYEWRSRRRNLVFNPCSRPESLVRKLLIAVRADGVGQ